jgi:DNA-binding response OmpR family regulator
LIVDPAATCRPIQKDMEETGFQVDRATSGPELETLSAGAFDLILVDLDPGGKSMSLIRQIKEGSFTDTPLVILSYSSDKQSVIQALEMGAQDYIVKPCSPEILAERIGQILNMESHGDIFNEYVSFNMHELVEIELKRAYRGKYPLALLLLTFRTKIPLHGQAVNILQNLLRDVDTVIRYGSASVLVFLPMTNREGTSIVLERIHDSLESLHFLEEVTGLNDFQATVVTFPEDGSNKNSLLAKLDSRKNICRAGVK